VPIKLRIRRSSTQMKKDPFTLRIAMNHENKANGTIYIDDGKTFDYKKGEYIKRNFIFENNVLKNVECGCSKRNKNYSIQNLIERIIIFGIKKPQNINLILDPNSELGLFII
jgi:mannosyl-oligosaccharide alpha-1,3-glucosidase